MNTFYENGEDQVIFQKALIFWEKSSIIKVYRKFYNSLKLRFFNSYWFMPLQWNDGIMEYWNNVFKTYNFSVRINVFGLNSSYLYLVWKLSSQVWSFCFF